MSSVTPVTKTTFVAEALGKDPTFTLDAVNRAWQKAGHEDTISVSTYHKVKAGLVAPPNPEPSPDPGPPLVPAPEVWNGRRNGRIQPTEDYDPDPPAGGFNPDTSAEALDIERAIDGLVYRTMATPGFEEVADALRAARRVLILSQG